MNKRKSPSVLLMLLPIYLFTIIFVLGPLLYMVFLSFMEQAEGWGVVFNFSLNNYLEILEPIYLNTFKESFKLAFITTFFVILIGYPFGYYMAKLETSKRKIYMFLLMVPFWTSSLMRLYGWIIIFRSNGILDKILMGLNIISKPLKLLYTYPAVVAGMVYTLLPFMIYSVYSNAEKMDWSLIEAAKDLGANRFVAFTTITLKLTLPGLFSGIIFTFIPSMGLFFIAEILGGNKVVLVGNLIQEQLMKAHNWPFAAALSVTLLLLTSILLFINKKITHSKNLEGIL